MIEIALYDHRNDDYTTQNYPVSAIEQFSGNSFADFQKAAKHFIQNHSNDNVVVINEYPAHFNINLFAVALVIESLRMDCKINCVAINVNDLIVATEAFKPFIALTFGLKYVHTLQEMDASTCFKDISALGYLGLDIKQNHTKHQLTMSLSGTHKLPGISAHSFSEAIGAVAFIKTLALMKKDYALKIELPILKNSVPFDEDAVFEKIVNHVCALL